MRRPFIKLRLKDQACCTVCDTSVCSTTVPVEMYFFICPRVVFFMTGLLEVDMYQKIL